MAEYIDNSLKRKEMLKGLIRQLHEGKTVDEFWIQMQGRFIHIRYFALRDADRAYQGTLETVQDITPLRALQRERRLLDDEG